MGATECWQKEWQDRILCRGLHFSLISSLDLLSLSSSNGSMIWVRYIAPSLGDLVTEICWLGAFPRFLVRIRVFQNAPSRGDFLFEGNDKPLLQPLWAAP
jgi:hypothetical protein